MRRRKLISGHKRMKKLQTMAINTLHALFVSQGITTMKKKDLATAAAREKAFSRAAAVFRSFFFIVVIP
jgi:hypothetical protein